MELFTRVKNRESENVKKASDKAKSTSDKAKQAAKNKLNQAKSQVKKPAQSNASAGDTSAYGNGFFERVQRQLKYPGKSSQEAISEEQLEQEVADFIAAYQSGAKLDNQLQAKIVAQALEESLAIRQMARNILAQHEENDRRFLAKLSEYQQASSATNQVAS